VSHLAEGAVVRWPGGNRRISGAGESLPHRVASPRAAFTDHDNVMMITLRELLHLLWLKPRREAANCPMKTGYILPELLHFL
jgi:hypothetical protein